jgi:hypothetical protein
MKKTKKYTRFYIFLLCAMVFTTGYTLFSPDTKTELDEFAKKLLATLQTKKFDAYHQLIMTNTEFTDMVMASAGDEESKMQTIASYEEGLNEDKKVEFDELIHKMEAFGVDFTKIAFKEVLVDEYDQYGIKVVNIAVVFNCGQDEHQLNVLSVFKTKNGWKMSGAPMIQEPKEKDETCNDFTKEVLTALANKNEKAFYGTVMTNAELLDMMKKMGVAPEMEEQVKEQMKTEGPEAKKEMWYNGFFTDATEGNLDLGTALPTARYTYEKRTEQNISVTMVSAELTLNEKKYWISFTGVKSPMGWKLVEPVKLNYEGKLSWDFPVADTAAYDPYMDSTMINNEDLQRELEKMQMELDSAEHAMRADSVKRAEEHRKEKEEKKNKKKKKK